MIGALQPRVIGRAARRRTDMVRAAVVLFNRDLRVHDHPALSAAARAAEHVVRLFVWDDALLSSSFAAPNRLRFLLDSLADLDARCARAAPGLVVRRGDVVARGGRGSRARRARRRSSPATT